MNIRSNFSQAGTLALWIAFLWTCGFPEEFPKNQGCTSPRPYSPISDDGKKNMPLVSQAITIMCDDKFGQAQAKIMQNTIRVMKGPMEQVIHKKRPCGCDGSFPSGHMMNIGWPAAFIYHRYGWQYGLPLYVGAGVYAKDRHDAKAHYWSDLIGTTLLMHGIGYMTVHPYQTETNKKPSALDRFHFILTHDSFMVIYDLHKVK